MGWKEEHRSIQFVGFDTKVIMARLYDSERSPQNAFHVMVEFTIKLPEEEVVLHTSTNFFQTFCVTQEAANEILKAEIRSVAGLVEVDAEMRYDESIGMFRVLRTFMGMSKRRMMDLRCKSFVLRQRFGVAIRDSLNGDEMGHMALMYARAFRMYEEEEFSSAEAERMFPIDSRLFSPLECVNDAFKILDEMADELESRPFKLVRRTV